MQGICSLMAQETYPQCISKIIDFLDVRASHYHTIKISYALCKHGICAFYCMALLNAYAHYTTPLLKIQ